MVNKMRKIALAIMVLILLSAMPGFAFAAESNLMEDIQIDIKSAETPNRIEISFILAEPIDLSQGNSNIIFEYFTMNDSGTLEAIRYGKDKSWSGYLNSYDNYPAGERKYSSGKDNGQYPDQIPATKIYTSTRTNNDIDAASVAAVKVTVLRSDGSGEKVTAYSDGTAYDVEEIEADIADDNKSLGIIMESTTSELPADTILVANELTSGTIYEKASSLLTDAKHFIAIDITLESGGAKIQPDGKVRISIPIPDYFSGTNLAVYRIGDDGSKIPYPVIITAGEGTSYATFEADHFSAYILAEIIAAETETEAETGTGTQTGSGISLRAETRARVQESAGIRITGEDEIEETEIPLGNVIPQTGAAQTSNYSMAAIIICVSAIMLLIKRRAD